MPRLFAAAPASTLRPVVSPNCSLITYNNCRLFSSTLTSQYPTPPGPALCALLRLYRSRVGLLIPALLFLSRLGGFSRLSESVQFLAQFVALPFGLFAPTLLFHHPLAQHTLRHFAAGTFGVELFAELSQLAGRAGALRGLLRL